MEKAILKTLIYADIFDYPLKLYEIHKWLISSKVNLRQVEKALNNLVQSRKCKKQSGYYFLPRRAQIVTRRKQRQKQSSKYLRKAQILGSILKLIPTVKLVGISGGLSMENAQKADDIDLFVITSANRLWVSRLFILGILSLSGQRRKVGENGRKIAGKLCINTLLEESNLEQSSKDIYLAHEILQMKVLWQRDGIYQKYLKDNSWAFKFLPNWVGNSEKAARGRQNHTAPCILHTAVNLIEVLSKYFQLMIMKPAQGMERIEAGALYFHPQDVRPKVLAEYKKRVNLISP